MKTKKTLTLIAAASLALAAAACADDNNSADNNSAGNTTTEATTTTETDTTEEPTTEESESDTPTDGTVVDTAVAADDFNTLVEALEAADLVETLQGDGPFTVFAPTDTAFEALPDGTLDELLADPGGDLTEILTYHVIEGEVLAQDVMEMDGETVETLQGEVLTIQIEGEEVWLEDATGNSVQVIDPDMEASNGVIHAIDAVLMPMPAEEEAMG